jgi:NAD+ kinase
VPLDQAEQVVALGGDGFMLQTLHAMLERRRILPVFGMNLGTIGFLMNDWRLEGLEERLARAKPFRVSPLSMTATTVDGEHCVLPAINEVSLLRETRQTAKLEVTVNDRVVLPEGCATACWSPPPRARLPIISPPGPDPAARLGAARAHPDQPVPPAALARRDPARKDPHRHRVLEADKRPVSAVADQREVREVAQVDVEIDHMRDLTLLFDPEHALDDRITMEQFIA